MMKFSEALRLGSMMCPKAIGIRLNDDGERCALGAAAFGAGIEVMAVEACWRELVSKQAVHPVLGEEMQLVSIVASLNNGFFARDYPDAGFETFEPWTREAIADWYEQFEPEPVVPTIREIREVAEALVFGVSLVA